MVYEIWQGKFVVHPTSLQVLEQLRLSCGWPEGEYQSLTIFSLPMFENLKQSGDRVIGRYRELCLFVLVKRG